jgi:hypothetical protein
MRLIYQSLIYLSLYNCIVVQSAAITERWVLGSSGQGCTATCTNAGLKCAPSQIKARDHEVDSKEEIIALMEKAGVNCDTSHAEWSGLDYGVPFYNGGKCAYSATSRKSHWGTCGNKYSGSVSGYGYVGNIRRLCFCYNNPNVPTVSNLFPSLQVVGGMVNITGESFGTSFASINVTINDVECTSVKWISSTKVQVTVPSGGGKNLPVVVNVDGWDSSPSYAFTYKAIAGQPVIIPYSQPFDLDAGVVMDRFCEYDYNDPACQGADFRFQYNGATDIHARYYFNGGVGISASQYMMSQYGSTTCAPSILCNFTSDNACPNSIKDTFANESFIVIYTSSGNYFKVKYLSEDSKSNTVTFTFEQIENCAITMNCPSGTYISTNGTRTTNRVCTSCPNGTFSTAINSVSCTNWTICNSTETESNAGSTKTDRSCTTLKSPSPTANTPSSVVISPSPSNSDTVEVSPSPSNSATVGVSPSPSNSDTVGVSPSPSNFATAGVPPSPSNSATIGVSPSPVGVSPSPSNSATVGVSPSPSNSATVGVSPSPSNFATAGVGVSPSPVGVLPPSNSTDSPSPLLAIGDGESTTAVPPRRGSTNQEQEEDKLSSSVTILRHSVCVVVTFLIIVFNC